MHMNAPVSWNAPVSGNVTALQGRWNGLRKGLRLVQIGHCVLLLLALPGLTLLWLERVQLASGLTDLFATYNRDYFLLVSWLLAGVGIALGSGLLMLGQYCCLHHAPQRHSGKELMFVCLVCIPPIPMCLALSWFLGDSVPSASSGNTFLKSAEWLQLGAAVLVLANVLLFTQFLRAVGKCVAPFRSSTSFFWFVGFLAGVTLGLFSAPSVEVFLALEAGWCLALVWHVVIIELVRRSIRNAISGKTERGRVAEPVKKLKPDSWLHPRISF
jgi:hypothetical protein